MSGKRLAVLAAAGQAGDSHDRSGPDGSPPNTTHPAHLRGGERPSPPLNLLLTSAVLGGLMAAVCAACYCCSRNARGKSRRRPVSASSHGTISSRPVYTLPQECEHNSLCYDSGGYLPPYRRPPTPGPPPAYDSVVSRHDKLRHFGVDDEYTEDNEKIYRYTLRESLGPEELMMISSESMSDMDTLKFCISNKKNGICNTTDDDDVIKIHCPFNCDRQIRNKNRKDNKNTQEEEINRDVDNLERKREVVFTISFEEKMPNADSPVDDENFYCHQHMFSDELDCSTSAKCESETRMYLIDTRRASSIHTTDTREISSHSPYDGDNSLRTMADNSVNQHDEFSADIIENNSRKKDEEYENGDEALPTYEAATSSQKTFHPELI